MQSINIHGIMAERLKSLASYLASFLHSTLPSLHQDWWNITVIQNLTVQQENWVRQRNITSLSGLDLAALLRIFDRNWSYLSEKYTLFSESRSFLKELQFIRNRWAHAHTEDFPTEDIYRDLDTIQRLCKTIGVENDFIDLLQSDKNNVINVNTSCEKENLNSSSQKTSAFIQQSENINEVPQSNIAATQVGYPQLSEKERAFVIIKGVKILTEREGSKSAAYFNDILPKLLPLLPTSEIENLQSIPYCYEIVKTGIGQYPILSKCKEDMIDAKGKLRAYSQTIAGFWVSAQWNDGNLYNWKLYLERLSKK